MARARGYFPCNDKSCTSSNSSKLLALLLEDDVCRNTCLYRRQFSIFSRCHRMRPLRDIYYGHIEKKSPAREPQLWRSISTGVVLDNFRIELYGAACLRPILSPASQHTLVIRCSQEAVRQEANASHQSFMRDKGFENTAIACSIPQSNEIGRSEGYKRRVGNICSMRMAIGRGRDVRCRGHMFWSKQSLATRGTATDVHTRNRRRCRSYPPHRCPAEPISSKTCLAHPQST